MVYYLIGAQLLNKSEDYTWQQIKSQVLAATLGSNAQGKIIRQEKEKFRLGNLDQLMYINDMIIKQEVTNFNYFRCK
jgi:V-type H+-transporting ATPase subunit C